MIDVHCHLNFHKFDSDVEEVINRAKEAGVDTIINTGTSIASSLKTIELAEKYEGLYSIVGIHPHHADKSDVEFEGVLVADWLQELEKIAKSSKKVVGIGEIGMDYWNYRSNGVVPKDLQEDAFRRQIELAIKLNLPLQIHTRLAWDDTIEILSEYKKLLLDPPGMFHCFSGDIDFTRKVLNLGFYVGFDGNITYKGIPPGETTALSDLVKFVPMDRILTETDSPFLTPVPLRGQRNEPKNVIIVGQFIAQLKKISYEEVDAAVLKNAHTLFSFD